MLTFVAVYITLGYTWQYTPLIYNMEILLLLKMQVHVPFVHSLVVAQLDPLPKHFSLVHTRLHSTCSRRYDIERLKANFKPKSPTAPSSPREK